MLLAAYKAKGSIWDQSIRKWTGKPYSHCELVVNGSCYSSSPMDGGVRNKSINIYNGKWDLFPLTKFNELQVLNYYQKTKGNKYSYFDLFFNQIINSRFTKPNNQFCSEWCAEALGLPSAHIYNPGVLVELTQYIETL